MKLNLARKSESMPSAVEAPKDPEVHYPTLYLSDVEGLGDLPEEGTAMIKFKRKNLTVTDREGKKSVSADIEIQSLDCNHKDKKSSKPEKSAEEAFDETMAEAEEASKENKDD